MARVLANNEHFAMASNDLALVAHFLDRRTYLHIIFLSVMRLPLSSHPAAGENFCCQAHTYPLTLHNTCTIHSVI